MIIVSVENLIAKSQIAAEEKIGQKAEITSDVNDDELEKEGGKLLSLTTTCLGSVYCNAS